MDLMRERDKALKNARAFAASGNVLWAQLWLDRAGQFWPVTSRQLGSVRGRCRAGASGGKRP